MKLHMFLISCLLLTSGCTAKPIELLMLGGDRHHDYELCYGKLDREVLEADASVNVVYTEDIAVAAAKLASCDVFMACGNVPYDDAFKKAILAHLDRGRGMMLMHAAVWKRDRRHFGTHR